MSDVIRLDKILVGLIKEYREIELADRQKCLSYFEEHISDSDDSDRYLKLAKDMINIWSLYDDKEIIVCALRAAIGEIKRKNNWQ